MDLLNAQFERIKTQLAGLSITQRMLVGTLVALMGITVYYWSHYAGNPEMVPVLDGQLTGVEMAGVEHALAAEGVSYTTSNGQILVPADKKMDVVANLAYANELPHDSSATFQAIMKDLSPFSGSDDRELHVTQYLQQALEQMIHRFPGVADVSVLLNTKNEYRIDGSLMPSASVTIATTEAPAGSKIFHKLVDSTAGVVAAAVPGLSPGHVTVVIDGRSDHGKDDSDGTIGGSDLMETEQAFEDDKERHIREQFPDICGLNVNVACDIQNAVTTDRKVSYDPKTSMTKDTEVDEKEQDMKNTTSGAEPGVWANTSASIASVPSPSASGGSESTNSETKTQSQTFAGVDETSTSTPAGKPKVISAALRVPRSYIVSICKKKPTDPDPTDAAVATRGEQEMANIRDTVTKMLAIPPEAVSIETYTDVTPLMAMATTPTTLVSGNSPSLSTVTGHAKEIGVLALAVMSLFMMSSMVRKATPAPVIVAEKPQPPPEPSVLSSGELLAGEAGVSDPTLDGMELDDDAVRAQQMLDQVTTMVKDNPDSAAALVKRWLNRT